MNAVQFKSLILVSNKISLFSTEPEYKTKLIEFNKALSKTFEEFVLATEEVLKACGMVIKKVDKKRDHILINQHKEKLCKQLYETNDNAASLHLTLLIIFTSITGFILHASGRFVSQILEFIRPSMSSEQNILLLRFHGNLNFRDYMVFFYSIKSLLRSCVESSAIKQ